MRISDWSSDVCSSDLLAGIRHVQPVAGHPFVEKPDPASEAARRRIAHDPGERIRLLGPEKLGKNGKIDAFIAESECQMADQCRVGHVPRRHPLPFGGGSRLMTPGVRRKAGGPGAGRTEESGEGKGWGR